MPKKIKVKTENQLDEFSEDKESQNTDALLKPQLKRKSSSNFEEVDDESEEQDDELPMKSILNQFESDLRKTTNSKRKKLDSFIKGCMSTHTKVNAMATGQKESRVKLVEEYKKQISTLISQWESDLEKNKEYEEKITSLMNQQMKLISQMRVVQTQRLKSISQLHEHFISGVNEMEMRHSIQQQTTTEEMQKQLFDQQQKMVKDVRLQEISNMRKSLASMLYQ